MLFWVGEASFGEFFKGLANRSSSVISSSITGLEKKALHGLSRRVLTLGVLALSIGALLTVLPLISIPRLLAFTVNAPKSQILLSEHFVVPPATLTHSVYLNERDNVSFIVTAHVVGELNTSANDVIDFSVKDSSQTYLSFTKISHLPYNFIWTVPKSANYSFVYDNNFSTFSKDIIVQLTKYWIEPESHQLSVNSPLIPFACAYVGIPILLAGIGVAVFWIVRKRKD